MFFNEEAHRVVNTILDPIGIPDMFMVRQTFEKTKIDPAEIPSFVRGIIQTKMKERIIRPGMRIAITAGSREICNIALILRSAAETFRRLGAEPFIIPAMGSHGGGTAEGQRAMIEGYGITEAYCGCPILSSMETVLIGETEDGQPVYIDRYAAEADGIFVIGRVKLHTDFRGKYESGIMKMMAIGLGKQKGAQSCHRQGFGHMAENVRKFGHAVLENSAVTGALAILENAYDQTAELVCLDRSEIEDREPVLLERARTLMPRILLPECDVLIVDEIGKNYSGVGMDSNVTGRHATPFSEGGLRAQRVAVLGLSEKTHHNGYGLGLADCTTSQVIEELDEEAMFVNALTTGISSASMIPLAFDTPERAVKACIRMCTGIEENGPRIIRIPNTLHLEKILVSVNLADAVRRTPCMELEGTPFRMKL